MKRVTGCAEGGSPETSAETGECVVVSKYVELTGIEDHFDIVGIMCECEHARAAW